MGRPALPAKPVSSAGNLTLLIPGLLGPFPERELRLPKRLPAIETLLGRGRRFRNPTSGLHATLAHLFNLSEDLEPPVAALCRLGDGLTAQPGYWLRLDPVHLVAGMHSVLLQAYQGMPVLWEEAQALIDAVNRLFAEQGWMLEAGSPQRWYLRVPEPVQLQTVAVGEMLGRDIATALPQGADGLRWHAHLNELQMLLHASPVNRVREGRGELAINGVWPWGGGCLPEPRPVPWQRVASTECMGRGLATLCGVSVEKPPSDLEHWLGADCGAPSLVVMDGVLQALQHHDWSQWWEALERLESQWFAPLCEALREGRLETLELFDCRGRGWRVRGGDLNRWWRRRRPVEHWIAGDA